MREPFVDDVCRCALCAIGHDHIPVSSDPPALPADDPAAVSSPVRADAPQPVSFPADDMALRLVPRFSTAERIARQHERLGGAFGVGSGLQRGPTQDESRFSDPLDAQAQVAVIGERDSEHLVDSLAAYGAVR